MNRLPIIIDTMPILNEVSTVVKNGLDKIIYEYSQCHLMNEMEKCKAEVEYYKKELENLKKLYTQNPKPTHNIQLNIQEINADETKCNITPPSFIICNIFFHQQTSSLSSLPNLITGTWLFFLFFLTDLAKE